MESPNLRICAIAALVLGVAGAINATGQPDTNIRPQRCTMNAPQPGFATIAEIKVANVSVSVGGTQDAFDYSALGVGQSLDMPTLTPANRATVLGNYTGFVPPGYVGGAPYTFCASFKGVIPFPSGPQKPGLFEIGMYLSPLASGRR